MPTFTWDKLTVHVGEMNRGVALTCARELDKLIVAHTGDDESLFDQANLLVASHAPALVKVGDQIVNGNGIAIEIDGLPVSFKLPITIEGLNALPLSLSNLWIEAALKANGWLMDAIKNACSRATESISAPQSGSGQS